MDTILITGATSGIGKALAKRYLNDGNNVIICGRNDEKLLKVKTELSGVRTILSDVSIEEERVKLFKTIESEYPDLNVLVNNAGIQLRTSPINMDWEAWKREIETDFSAPLHLCGLFAPFLKGKKNAQIINVSSGLAFMPLAMLPVYCATKAGLHSFTFAIRTALKNEGIKVTEIIPPAVNTNLGGHEINSPFAADLDEFADSVYKDLKAGLEEIGFGHTKKSADRTRRELENAALERKPL